MELVQEWMLWSKKKAEMAHEKLNIYMNTYNMITMSFSIHKRRKTLILYMVHPRYILKNDNSKKKKEKQKGNIEWLLEYIKQNK